MQRDRTRDSPFLPENALKTYLVPGWKARLSARHVWKMQKVAVVVVALFDFPKLDHLNWSWARMSLGDWPGQANAR